MKLLIVSKLDRYARAVTTISKYVQVGKADRKSTRLNSSH